MSDQDTINAAINAKFATPPVITLKQAQAATTDYVNTFVTRRYVPERLMSGEVPIPGGRVIVRSVCRTEANANVFRARVTAALEDQILAGDLGPFTFETENVIDPTTDETGDWYIAESTWTY